MIKKTKALELKSRVTVRAIWRILRAVQSKLIKALTEQLNGDVTPDDIKRAMSHPATKEIVQKHMAKGNVKLVHKDSFEPVFQKQMSEIGEKGAAATNDDTLIHDPEEAQLVATQEALREMGNTVNELVRTNSL